MKAFRQSRLLAGSDFLQDEVFLHPQANSFSERWVRSIREEFLEQVLIVNQRHLRRVLGEYTDYFNRAWLHQGIGQRIPNSGR